MGDEMTIFTCDPNGVKEILASRQFEKPSTYRLVGYPFNEKFLGNGLLTDFNTQRWKKKRDLFNPGFHKSVVLSLAQDFNEKVDLLLARLRNQADGKTPIPLLKELNKLTLDVIANIALGFNIDCINDSNQKLNKLIDETLVAVNKCFMDPFINVNPFKMREVNGYKNLIRELRSFSRQKIEERLEKIEAKSDNTKDILSVIINNSNDDRLEIEDLVDDFLTFFIAGQETTANSIAFMLMELAQNPDILEKLRKEINDVMGEKQEVTSDDLAKIPYSASIFKEALRKWPPGGEFARISTEETSINGFKIPKNTNITVSPFVSGRIKEYFKDPLEFKPERFEYSKDETEKITSHIYFPFSLGGHSCIGQNFAQIEARIFLIKFVKNFNFVLDPNQSMDIIETITLRPKDYCRMFLSVRDE